MLGERLMKLRKERKLTQEQFALKLGIPRSTYSNYESGKREPDFDITNQMAEFFGVSIDYLMGRSDVKNTVVAEKISEKKKEALEIIRELPDDDITLLTEFIKRIRNTK